LDEEEFAMPQNVVDVCEILGGFFRISFPVLTLDFRDVFALCKEPNVEEVRIAAYQLLETRAKNCEEDTLEAFCLDTGLLGIVAEGIRDGVFQIRASSAETLLQIVNGNSRLNRSLINVTVIEPMVSLLEDETWRARAVTSLHTIFERAKLDDQSVATEFCDHFTCCGGFDALERILNDDGPPSHTTQVTDRFLSRLCSGDVARGPSTVASL
jgi:hypothetical protein